MERVNQLRFDAERWRALVGGLLLRTDVESAALVFAERVRGLHHDVLVVRQVVHVPEDAFEVHERDQIEINPIAFNRLTRPARDQDLAVVTVHTHPMARQPWFSCADDMGDARLMPSLANRIPGQPHGSMVIVPGPDAIARVFEDGRNPRLVSVRVVGSTLDTFPIAPPNVSEPMFARQRLALGASGQAALRRLRVGVVGLGGTGSVVAAQLAHVGVGHLVLVDDDRVEITNLSRILGATRSDIGAYKVDVASRYAEQVGAASTAMARAVSSAGDGDLLSDCDLVMSCVDRHTPRALLSRLAYRALLPVIDMGSQFRVDASTGRLLGDGGRVLVAGPGRPCFACHGILDSRRLEIEALSAADREQREAEGYIDGADVPAPSVMPFNTTLAGAAVIELLRLAAGFASDAPGPNRLGFSFSGGTCKRVGVDAREGCLVCGTPTEVGHAGT